jgi:hypothetical protein
MLLRTDALELGSRIGFVDSLKPIVITSRSSSTRWALTTRVGKPKP